MPKTEKAKAKTKNNEAVFTLILASLQHKKPKAEIKEEGK